MPQVIKPGHCVKQPGKRIGRVREVTKDSCKIRVRRVSGKSNQFVVLPKSKLTQVACP